jgi:hypothetical protein
LANNVSPALFRKTKCHARTRYRCGSRK